MPTTNTILVMGSCVHSGAFCQDTGIPLLVVAMALVVVIALVIWLNRSARR